MSADSEIRQFLDRMASEPFIGPIDPVPLVRRARGRMLRTIAIAAVTVAVAGAGVLGGLSLVRSGRPTPADRHTVTPLPPLMQNGPLTLFGFTNGVRQANLDGSAAPPLVDCAPSDACTDTPGAAWSPDGTRLAYTVVCGGGCGSAGNPYHGLRVLDLRTGEDRLLVPGDAIHSVDWSPDGTQVAFTARVGTSSRITISVVDADGASAPVLVANDAGGSPSWSPDGTRIVYSDLGQMWVQRLDGSDPVWLGPGLAPHWSRDGSRMAYLQGRLSDCEVWTMAPDGTDRARLASIGASCNRPDGYPATLTWSPDGTQIAVFTTPVVELIDVASGDRRAVELADRSGASGIAWRPVTTPQTPTSELRPVLHKGEGLVQGNSRGRVDATDPRTGDRRTLADCKDPCVVIEGRAISADRRWLAYNVLTCFNLLPCEPEGGIRVTNALGEDRQLTQECDTPDSFDSCHGGPWAWSPQGATLAVYEGGDVAKLFTIDPQTGDRRTLATPDVDISYVAWSPDGSRILYGTNGLFSVDPGSGQTTLLSDRVGEVYSIEWSPDGTRLVLDGLLAGRDRILVMNADGSDQRVLADQGAPQGPGAPAWSPDGTRIAYVSTPQRAGSEHGHFSFEAWVIGADGSGRTRLFHGKCCIGDWDGPVWSPDGSRIAFFDDRDMDYGTWLVVNADGTGEPRRINDIEAKRWAQE